MIVAALARLRQVAKMGRVTMNQEMRKRNLSLDPYDTKWVVQSFETLTPQGLQGKYAEIRQSETLVMAPFSAPCT
ncbi:MAG: hypothetical protein RLZ67_1114, partial [Actinomycetota bacterium]